MKASDVSSIRTRRLVLVSLSKPSLEAIVGGRREETAAELGATLPPDWPDAHEAG